MTGKARLAALAGKLQQKPEAKQSATTASDKHGEKGDYVKLTVTLPPAVYELVMKEVTRRKVAKEAEPAISAVLREAVVQYLK